MVDSATQCANVRGVRSYGDQRAGAKSLETSSQWTMHHIIRRKKLTHTHAQIDSVYTCVSDTLQNYSRSRSYYH